MDKWLSFLGHVGLEDWNIQKICKIVKLYKNCIRYRKSRAPQARGGWETVRKGMLKKRRKV
jgi:hypothetical protein